MKAIDQMEREVQIPEPFPRRIISLVPSQTELLYDLGLDERVVGITEFCVRPHSWQDQKEIVGGTKLVLRKKVQNLKPDLIIGNKEENTLQDIQRLEKEYPVWMSDITTMDDALEMILMLGEVTKAPVKAQSIHDQIKGKLKKAADPSKKPLKIAYFIWKDPWMVAGGNTFINDFCKKMGFRNVFEDVDRYPEINLDQLEERNPDFIFLSSEPFPFKENHKKELSHILPLSKIEIIDGQMFSWYGSRLIKGIEYALQLKERLLKQQY